MRKRLRAPSRRSRVCRCNSAPPGSTFKVQSVLVNTPVTVRDAKGEMVHNLEKKDFHVTDNGVEQQISHFDLGSEPISVVVVVETSSRIAPMSAADSQDRHTADANGDGAERRRGDCRVQ